MLHAQSVHLDFCTVCNVGSRSVVTTAHVVVDVFVVLDGVERGVHMGTLRQGLAEADGVSSSTGVSLLSTSSVLLAVGFAVLCNLHAVSAQVVLNSEAIARVFT